MKKIVLVIDSFKGCLSSEEVEKTVKDAVQSVCKDYEVMTLPIADGGEGMLDVLVHALRGKYVDVEVHDPLMRPVRARYGMLPDNQTAIIEMAQASGLPLLSSSERNPLVTTSYGTGELIAHAVQSGCRQILVGIGGSATNDAGIGMMQALGAVFYDARGQKLSTGCGQLVEKVDRFDLSEFKKQLKGIHFSTACDVNNPFSGENGAAYVFAPQKGANTKEVEQLDRGLVHFAQIVEAYNGKQLNEISGAGAAGGMGGTLAAFFNSSLRPGIDLILEKINFAAKIEGADLIITGEGKADRQTLMGKVSAGILKYGMDKKVPVVLMAGAIEDETDLKNAGFAGIFRVTPQSMSLEMAMQPSVAKSNIGATAIEIIRNIFDER